MCGLVAAACSGGAGSPAGSSGPEATASTTTTAPSGVPASTTPACTNATVLAGWTVQRRASLLLVAPVLNYDMASVAAATSAGAGGILFLGPGTARAGLGTQLANAMASGPGPAPLAMADQEGGGIERLTPPVGAMPWPRTMAATMTTAQVQSLASTVGAEMGSLGVKVDLAPVADLDGRPGPSASNPDGQRSFSTDPTTASAYAVAFVKGMLAAGEVPVMKHFPGLGGSSGNTDYGPAQTEPLSVIESRALQPFRAAIGSGAPAVMVSNASVPGLTSLPASLSSAVIGGLLRNDLGFSGLVLTDSLSAGAISATGYDLPRAAAAAVEAGADMVLFGSTLTPAQTAELSPASVAGNLKAMSSAIASAVAAGELPVSRLDGADSHVLTAGHVSLC